MDADLRFTYMSANVEKILGIPPEWHYGKTREELLGEDYNRDVWDEHIKTLREHKPFRDFEYLRTGEGVKLLWLRASGIPVFTEEGTFAGYRGTGLDISKEMQAQERLRESEEQLLQAQKMEVVGQLTGGIAHDFNNLLAVIMGNSEMLLNEIGQENSRVQGILRASTRGAELVQRLLAFSRRQPLRPRPVDLIELVDGMSELIKRSLGETIEVETIADSDLWFASVDPGQVEAALLNLALNARDAMPGGGKLTIECGNVLLDDAYVAQEPELETGDYVFLAVTDSGTGMSSEVKQHAFEPFFTTKEVGEGSGLGLSMVYGFAKQSGGHVMIYSEEGKGTTVKLYLPRDKTMARREEPKDTAQVPHGLGEVVLVVEDDAEVCKVAVEMLGGLGYKVVYAREAASACALLEQEDRVDLVLADVILPGGISGPEFADQAMQRYPELKVIFMSGYPAEAAKRNGFLGSNKVLLNKPFQKRQLALALRNALDA